MSEYIGKVNKKYKDSLFRLLFGKEEHKHHLLSLYNALNKSNYTDVNGIKFYTLEDVIYINYKNDVAFIIDEELNMYEHQSSVNPNMALRGFLYAASEYEKYLKENKFSLFSSNRLTIPVPKYIVFYNGTRNMPEKSILKLSDMFSKPDTVCGYEWTATVININNGYNSELKDACSALKDYSNFVDMVHTNLKKGMDNQEAVEEAVNETIRMNNSLSDILAISKAEVITMFLSEFDQEAYNNTLRADGALQKEQQMYQKLLSKGKSVADIAEMYDEDVERVNYVLQLEI